MEILNIELKEYMKGIEYHLNHKYYMSDLEVKNSDNYIMIIGFIRSINNDIIALLDYTIQINELPELGILFNLLDQEVEKKVMFKIIR